jgi:septum formation protein
MFGGAMSSATSTSRVLIHSLDDGAVNAYVRSGRPMDKAGAYGIQDDDVPTVDALDGCFCGVMGLPLWLTSRLLRDIGGECRGPALERCLSCPERPR